mmetsp:Transcript_17897/g.20452  ORF Transcript_17897/g.20452 Transcript_17897/m.20452 type:complete len:353 (+) Transcript_17897:127-1185(+)|eukprot:CAMPEP_0176462676 /NCGR_PEP_ID=MMETSP0127-20121128/35421_1 /TAXON_ID=938130 /ORGANISM="Platyophrya macrostoma, Strain WH" /LENGTH=352 /DNA_ID=CAMNT_0017854663 /DNA_START=124 /DNA_END=1182 /DNA_ORIENTATION=+
MHRSAPSPLTFLADRTVASLQQQNMLSPVTPKQHNPYAAAVIPENPEEVLMYRSLSQLDSYARSPLLDAKTAFAESLGTSPLTQRTPLVEFPVPISPFGSFSASPYQDAVEALSVPPPMPKSTPSATPIGLTKVYVGGRPMAVPAQSAVAAAPSSLPCTPVTPAREEVVSEPALPKDITVTVTFRRNEAHFSVRDCRSVFGSSVRGRSQVMGRYVLVEGDRGDDLGRITAVSDAAKDDVTRLPSVRRVATKDEINRFETTQRQEELRALEVAQQQAARFFGNENLSIEDATFQFDKQKLTLWYRVPDRVYFVPLLKALNQAYRCRIWMERLDGPHSPSSPVPSNAGRQNNHH